MTDVERLDEAVAKWSARVVRSVHVPLLRTVTQLGGTELVVVAGITAGVVSRFRRGKWNDALRLAAVIGGQNLAHNVIKRVTNRARPDGPHHSFFAGTSFPSGHTTTAAASWPAIITTVAPPASPATRIASFGVGPAVGATRVLLGVHWLSDVVAGLVLGWGWLALVRAATRTPST